MDGKGAMFNKLSERFFGILDKYKEQIGADDRCELARLY